MLVQQTVDRSGEITNREETEKKYPNLYIVDKRLFIKDYFVKKKNKTEATYFTCTVFLQEIHIYITSRTMCAW